MTELTESTTKSILKVWLKDRTLAQDVASTLVDLLKSKTTDVLAQQRAKRQFEEIGERVATSLLPVFESEGGLDEGGRNAVALAVAETFDKAGIDPELLAGVNLEPTRLAQHLTSSNPDATRDFSDSGKSLYRRIISESSQYIVDIASQLPNFTERTFAEVLTRENQLLAVANRILEEVSRIRAESQQAYRKEEAEAARFETEYRRAVVRKLDELQLFGADVSSANKRHSLSIAYVTLSVARKAAGAKKDEGRDIAPANEALAKSRRLLIRGEAGSGKTTLLQWVAVRSASPASDGQASDWSNTVPFFIRLRQCVESGLPAPEDFPRLVASSIADTMPKGWVHQQLKSGRAVVLVDGVDEVPESKREDVRSWLNGLVDTFPKSRYVITSRPHAIEEDWMEQEGFDDAELQRMALSDVMSFIDHWHAAVRAELLDEAQKAELEPLAENLKDVVRRDRPLRNLATNPLLCAMLCAMHRDRHQHLPKDRIELYEACCYLLLERRDIERTVLLNDYPDLSYRQKRTLLEDLSYWMLHNGWSEVSRLDMDDRLSLRLTNMSGLPADATGGAVRRYFAERSGIVREPVVGKVEFAHRTFQEFLAAKAALDEGDLGVLTNNAHSEQWREVIILAAGLASQKQQRERLINSLIARGDKESEHRHQLHLLAVACLETVVELSQEVKTKVQQRLAQLVPPKNEAEVRALASAGELAAPHLIANSQHSETEEALCVRALGLIGDEAALRALESYTSETWQTVIDELVRAWDYSFDRTEYARRILSQIHTLTHLKLTTPPSLEGLQYLTHLTSLDLSRCKWVSDLTPLAGLINLTSLDLSFCEQVSDLTPLAGLTNLTSLDLRWCARVSDLTPLAGLTSLTSLDLSVCERVSDLTPLRGLRHLQKVRLYRIKEGVEIPYELKRCVTWI